MYYPKGTFKVGDKVRISSSNIVGSIATIRLDSFGDEIFDILISTPQTVLARVTELKPEV